VASDAFSPGLRGGAINGRDEWGFVKGSEASARAARYHAKEQLAEKSLRRTGVEGQLIEPRYPTKADRWRAREAAEDLGVEVPEWARLQRKKRK
jgi:hypothetical protein